MSVPPNEVPSGNTPVPNDVVTPPSSPSGVPTAEERQWAMFAHLSALLGGILTSHLFGWGCFLGPLIIWLLKKDTLPFVNDQGKEALNFNITAAIIGFGLLVLSVPLTIVTLGLWLILAVPVAILLGIAWLVVTIIAAVKANEGVAYRYPVSLRLIK